MGAAIVVTSDSLMWCNGGTLAWNARDVALSPALGIVFPIFVTAMTLVTVTMILYKLRIV